ncbi:hypothetical protein GBA52_023363 [Prunus armeniaca]|nr:hypothetical protein GBA52_023363 [Prunus armeniaca]
MEAWDFHDVKAEKASAMRRYNRIRSVAKLFRFAELGAGVVFVSWTFSRLPIALTLSRDYFRLLFGVVSSPLFVFFLCHTAAVEAKLCEELIENCGGGGGSGSSSKSQFGDDVISGVREEEEVVYQDKQIVSEVNSADPKADTDSASDSESEFPKIIRRTRSEKFEREPKTEKLRRSETEIGRKIISAGEDYPPENMEAEDNLSNEEFQRTIEAFIEKQLKFRHQESLAIVLPNKS